jgi:hypothetical protein
MRAYVRELTIGRCFQRYSLRYLICGATFHRAVEARRRSLLACAGELVGRLVVVVVVWSLVQAVRMVDLSVCLSVDMPRRNRQTGCCWPRIIFLAWKLMDQSMMG